MLPRGGSSVQVTSVEGKRKKKEGGRKGLRDAHKEKEREKSGANEMSLSPP
jgi:hypothetical protein